MIATDLRAVKKTHIQVGWKKKQRKNRDEEGWILRVEKSHGKLQWKHKNETIINYE